MDSPSVSTNSFFHPPWEDPDDCRAVVKAYLASLLSESSLQTALRCCFLNGRHFHLSLAVGVARYWRDEGFGMGPTAARGNLTAGPDVTCGEEIQLLLQHKIIYADYLERGHDPSTCAGKEKAFGMERSVRNNLLQLVHSNNSPFILYSALDSVLDNIAGYPNSDDREVHKQLALHVAACLNTYEETYDASRTENLYTLDMALMVQKDVVRKLVDMATRAASFLVSEREFFSSFHMACVCKRIIEHLDGTLIVFDRPIDPGYRQRKRMLLWILAYSTAQVTAGEVPSNDFANGVMKRLRRKYGYRIPPREELDNAALAISWANTAETEGSEIILEDLPMGIFG